MTWEEAALADNYNNAVSRWASAYYDIESRFYSVRDELAETAQKADLLRSKFVQANAHAVAIGHQVKILKSAIKKLDPLHDLFRGNPAGQVWPAGVFRGQIVSNIGLFYITGFEEALMNQGVKPQNLTDWYIG